MKDQPAGDRDGEALELTGGLLSARLNAHLYLYAFPLTDGLWPESGRRGEFYLDGQVLPARLFDRTGPRAELILTADRPLPQVLSGRARFFPPAEPDLAPPSPDRPAPPGAALFLDPQEGWLWSATEAAGQRGSLYVPENWPRAPRRELPARLAAGGLTFIWSQAPSSGGETARLLAEHLRQACGRVLAIGDRPADLEPLADLPGALFLGDAPQDSRLGRASLQSRSERLQEARERRLAELRGALTALKNKEAAVRARLTQWRDLEELAGRFQALGREAERRGQERTQARATLEARRSAWEDAARAAESRGLWRRRKNGARTIEERRQALEAAEADMLAVRQAEETTLDEARRLKERLDCLARESETWPAREELEAELNRLTEEGRRAAALLAAEDARALPGPAELLAASELVLAWPQDLEDALAGLIFPAVFRLASRRPDARGRRALAALALSAARQLVVLGDFTCWPVWSGQAPELPERTGEPAWLGLTVAEEESPEREYLATGGLFRSGPLPADAPRLTRLELGRTEGTAADSPPRGKGWASGATRNSGDYGLGLRAWGEMGPVNPVSALTAARTALNFVRAHPSAAVPAALIVTASPAQGRLAGLMLRDLGAPPGLIFAGQPQDFQGWPRTPLVILEPAFEAPHLSHPWAWPTFGRWPLQMAWGLAGERLWLAGRDAWLTRLPAAAPLAALWRAAAPPDREADDRDPAPAPAFWEALDQARREVWAFLPAFSPVWWRPLEEHFLAAARRRVAITVLSAPPGPGEDRDFAGAALKTLGAYGCSVGLASGFPGFLAAVDGRHLAWGRLPRDGTPSHRLWSGLKTRTLPLAAAALGGIMQIELIAAKIGRRGGGLKTCRRCGWPLVLINQRQLRGLNDEQPLKIGCLGCGPGASPRLDERDPFTAPPRCGLDQLTPYSRQPRGRLEVWVCPNHPDGPSCPAYRVIPGDCP